MTDRHRERERQTDRRRQTDGDRQTDIQTETEREKQMPSCRIPVKIPHVVVCLELYLKKERSQQ